MLIEITSDEELKRLLGIDSGFLLIANYPSKHVTIHKINCKLCNPQTNVSLSQSDKKQIKTAEIWFSNKRQKIFTKAKEITEKKGYSITYCKICNP
jgi:hypothetical protein